MKNLGTTLKITCLLGVLAGFLPLASAVTYDVTAASPGNPDHIIWIPDIGFTANEFVPGGTFTEFGDGSAKLSGTALNGANGFVVDGTFTGHTAVAPVGSPKYEGPGSLQTFQMANSANWWYYTGLTGTLTGVGSFAGDEYSFVRYGPAFQLGYGANLKNKNFGGAAWLSIYAEKLDGVVVPAQFRTYTRGGVTKTKRLNRLHGDFNLDLERSVPDSGSVAMMLGGALLGLAMLRRRMK